MLPYLNVDLDLFYRNVSGMNHTAIVIKMSTTGQDRRIV